MRHKTFVPESCNFNYTTNVTEHSYTGYTESYTGDVYCKCTDSPNK